jgi:hypothetical protein
MSARRAASLPPPLVRFSQVRMALRTGGVPMSSPLQSWRDAGAARPGRRESTTVPGPSPSAARVVTTTGRAVRAPFGAVQVTGANSGATVRSVSFAELTADESISAQTREGMQERPHCTAMFILGRVRCDRIAGSPGIELTPSPIARHGGPA